MAKQTINLGTAPSGSGGDTPRSAFTKTQANIDELYAALGGSTLPAALPVANGGTGGGTQAAARTGLGLGAAAVAPIVGTVSQASGVPTGAIIEKGGTVAGFYTKYADGTMICWGYVAPLTIAITNLNSGGRAYYGNYAKTFPAVFYTLPSVKCSYAVSGSLIWEGPVGDPTITGFNSYLISDNAVSSAGTFYWMAIGRWY